VISTLPSLGDASTPPPYYISADINDPDFEPDDLVKDAEIDSDSDSDHTVSDASSPHTPSPQYTPTVPRSQSGSPGKPANAPLDPQRPLQGMIFNTLEEVVHFVYEYEGRRGYVWKKGESERNKHGATPCPAFILFHANTSIGKVKRLRLRCSCSSQRQAEHDKKIDPTDFRRGRTKRCSCEARVNIRLSPAGYYYVTSLNLTHNHPATHDDHLPKFSPPSEAQKGLVRDLASIKSLTRTDIHMMLTTQFSNHLLSLRQVSNLLDDARRTARNSVKDLGGDLVAIVDKLMKLKQADHRWVVHVEVNETTRHFERLFWMSPNQVSLAQRFSDVIINDIAMGRNMYRSPLNVFVVIDQFFASRNIAYSLHTSETADEHRWALDCLFEVLPVCPNRVFFSDADKGLDLAVSRRSTAEVSFHGRCLNHLDGNVTKNLAAHLGALFQSFREAFWSMYYSISPAALETAWTALVDKFPAAAPYLQQELWPDRERWAWTYVSTRFTCGVRTSGRVEGENRINKSLGDTKTSIHDLCMNLIKRAEGQEDDEAFRIRNVSLFS
jgi:hypothetical protein